MFQKNLRPSANNAARARTLRKKQTHAEELLWERLKNRALENFKFRRQVPLDRYVADFFCAQAKLIVEVDGSAHDTKDAVEHDAGRTAYLEEHGFLVIRFTNLHIEKNIGWVLEAIAKSVAERATPHPGLLPEGEGDSNKRYRLVA